MTGRKHEIGTLQMLNSALKRSLPSTREFTAYGKWPISPSKIAFPNVWEEKTIIVVPTIANFFLKMALIQFIRSPKLFKFLTIYIMVERFGLFKAALNIIAKISLRDFGTVDNTNIVLIHMTGQLKAYILHVWQGIGILNSQIASRICQTQTTLKSLMSKRSTRCCASLYQ